MVTEHLHQAMTDFGAKDGTNAGTVSRRVANGESHHEFDNEVIRLVEGVGFEPT